MKLLRVDCSETMLEAMATLYQEVWDSSDHSIKEQFLKHMSYKGYRGFALCSEEEEIIGFCYGYSSLPGQYYPLVKEFEPAECEKWLHNCFEFA